MTKTVSKEKVLMRTSWVSTIGNAILSASKVAVGIVAGSMAVLGDGIDSATDVVISIIMIITAGIVRRPPTRKYPYGYEKAESVATKVLSLVIFYAGIQMLVTTLSAIISGEERELPGPLAIYITVFSIAGKLALALYQYRQGRRIGSSLLIANAKNMRNDVVISVAVLLGLFFTFILEMPILDSVTGLLVSLFIIKVSVEIFMDSNAELMDGVKDVTVYHKIFEAVEQVPGAENPHRVRSSLIGGMYMIVLDIEADGSMTLDEAHRIAHDVEESIKKNVENVYDIVVHAEPRGKCHDAEKFGVTKDMTE
jgi:cation diffusion facilitator family transporter